MATDTATDWSVANAATWSDYLPDQLDPSGGPFNGQQQALRNLLALYAVTRNDDITGNGTWDDLTKYIKNAGAHEALFGNGGGMVSHVYIGGTETNNPYNGMNLILDKLRISAGPAKGHHTHFHIDIARPDIVALPDNLLAEDGGEVVVAEWNDALGAAAQSIAEEVESSFGFDSGELTMLFMDMPAMPPQYTPVMVAQVSETQQQGAEHALGICHPIENKKESRLSAINAIDPVMEAMSFIEEIVHRKYDRSIYASVYYAAKMTLLEAPKHGELKLDEKTQSGGYFSSDYSYEGPDRATVLVEVGGYKVKVIYHFVLMKNVPGSGEEGTATDDKSICPKGYRWKISTTTDADGNIRIAAIEEISPESVGATPSFDADVMSSWLQEKAGKRGRRD